MYPRNAESDSKFFEILFVIKKIVNVNKNLITITESRSYKFYFCVNLHTLFTS